MFYTPQMALKIKDDLKAASPINWRSFMGIGLGRNKDAARQKARQIAELIGAEDEIGSIEALIDRRDDFWPKGKEEENNG